ncbi:MAG: hypothetical protein ABI867_31660 [Kofleriaceae bacterium]
MRGVAAGIVAGVIAASMLVAPRGSIDTSSAQPAAPVDITRAKELYGLAEAAMTEKRFGDAARDYGAAYDITKDPVLFYKIGSANERGGKCDVALIYYRRYVREAKPDERFVALTNERITACGGDPKDQGSGSAVEPVPVAGSGSDAGSGSGSAATVIVEPVGSAGSGSAAPAVKPIRGKHRLAWVFVGGAVASFTVGAVLSYSADAAENDVEDLYVGIGGTPPVFDDKTRKRLDNLIAEGNRYEKLSWLSFGVAGALAISAAIRFATDKDESGETAKSVHLTPTVTPRGAGVSAAWRF